jgi:diguanylate cyclase (GGDEF)-like protein
VILGTLVLLAVARGWRAERSVLIVLAIGLGALAAADSAYLYLTSIGSYSSADIVSSGWVLGFLLVAVAAVGQRRATRIGRAPHLESPTLSMFAAALPYVPVAAAGLAVSYDLIVTPEGSLVDVLLGGTLVIFVLARQFLAMAENQRLYRELGRTHHLLEHQALHDPLTGLPNRGMFNDRLDRALHQPTAELGLLFCDLDDFKQVNDRYGHDVGDLLLIDVADRLLSCVRRDEDLVARLGGDEFAILLQNPDDAQVIADRVVERMKLPFTLADHVLEMTMSLGVTQHRTTPISDAADPAGADVGALGDWLLRSADQAMYVAKHSGKGQAVLSAS